MSAVRPCPPSVGEGHHDLHATDEVHVHQHDDLRASEQKTKSCLADVELALLTSPSLTYQPSDQSDQEGVTSIKFSSARKNKFYQDLK